MFKWLKSEWGNKTFRMGLSGGLDSRIIPHYAKEYDLKLTSFNICNKRPKGILMASSCKNAMKLAKAFKIPFKLIEWKPDRLEDKVYLKTKNQPLAFTGRNIFKFEQEGMPHFDIMLSGGFGILIGDYLPTDINILDKEGLIKAMERTFVKVFETTTFHKRCIKALNYVLHVNLQLKEKNDWLPIWELFQRDYDDIIDWIRNYVDAN